MPRSTRFAKAAPPLARIRDEVVADVIFAASAVGEERTGRVLCSRVEERARLVGGGGELAVELDSRFFVGELGLIIAYLSLPGVCTKKLACMALSLLHRRVEVPLLEGR